MLLVDVNVLIYAFWEGAEDHDAYRRWLTGLATGEAPFGMSDLVLSGFVRIVTNPRVLDPPARIETALAFVERLRQRPGCVPVSPGPRHWEIFHRLCVESGVKGGLVSDAFLAALAIESGCEWATTDRDYSRFAGLRTVHPLRAR